MNVVNWRPDKRQLRQFGWIALPCFPLLGWAVSHKLPEAFASGVLISFGALGLLCGVLAAFAPRGLLPVYLVMTGIAAVIGPIVAFVVLALLFLLVLTPIGLVFRVLGRDELKRRFDQEAETYWIPSDPPGDPASYFRQF